jgi:hypothetical protein
MSIRFCTAASDAPLAEVVEFGDEQRLPARLVGEDVDLDIVGPAHRFQLDAGRVLAVLDVEMLLPPSAF